MAGVDSTAIGTGIAAILSSATAGFFLLRGKDRDVNQATATWIVEQMREMTEKAQQDSEKAQAKADKAEATADEAMERFAACERERQEDRVKIAGMKEEIAQLRREVAAIVSNSPDDR